MNPGLVVKLRPSGPWRIGPDSGSRVRVDAIYHSDSVYSAVTWAMARFGELESWLDATARDAAPAVCFSSCFPFAGELNYVTPPATVWPPASRGLSTKVRWKSARFVPLAVVSAILSGRKPDENQWIVDGLSECLAPAGSPGPFKTSVRSSAAVDRLSGAAERHSVACIEFRPNAGLWTAVSFADDTARDRWLEPVKAAFRYLADSGFGGERSRGWGRSEAPEFIEGMLPELILPRPEPKPERHQPPAEPAIQQEPAPEPEPPAEAQSDNVAEPAEAKPESVVKIPAETSAGEPPVEESLSSQLETSSELEPESGAVAVIAPPEVEPLTVESNGTSGSLSVAEIPAPEVAPDPTPEAEPLEEPLALASDSKPHWLLSLYIPASADSVDWSRGQYSLISRSGRIDSPAGSGELKKQVSMVAEGSVLYAAAPLTGAAPDVAPDGFAHPVYRAGFAVAIALPEVS